MSTTPNEGDHLYLNLVNERCVTAYTGAGKSLVVTIEVDGELRTIECAETFAVNRIATRQRLAAE